MKKLLQYTVLALFLIHSSIYAGKPPISEEMAAAKILVGLSKQVIHQKPDRLVYKKLIRQNKSGKKDGLWCKVPECEGNKGKPFKTRRTLKFHHASIHLPKEYECLECNDNKLYTLARLTNHLQINHRILKAEQKKYIKKIKE